MGALRQKIFESRMRTLLIVNIFYGSVEVCFIFKIYEYKYTFFSFTLYSAYSRVGIGNLVLRLSVRQLPEEQVLRDEWRNSTRFALSPEQVNRNHNRRVYCHTRVLPRHDYLNKYITYTL